MIGAETIRSFARLLVEYSLELKEGDLVLITGDHPGMPLIREVYRASLRAGAHPDYMPVLPGHFDAIVPYELNEIYFEEADEVQLSFLSPLSELAVTRYDAILKIRSPLDTRALSGVDPERKALRSRACAPLIETYFRRESTGSLRWCLTVYPTESLAQDASMSLEDFSELLFKACKLSGDDPIRLWKKQEEAQGRIVTRLNGLHSLRIVGKDTDLSMRVEGRTWISCAGKLNLPDGEVFTGPVEDSLNGHITFSFPGVRAGVEIEDIRIRFQDGKAVSAHASKGEDLLTGLLATDTGAAYVGELGFGTNGDIIRFTRFMLLDEKMGGTVHLALGNGYPKTGSLNKSGIHWDLLCDLREEGMIYGDGEVIYRDGAFVG
jgi:aminopeptidase